MTKLVGDTGWDCGPIVVASPALLGEWGRAFGSSEAKVLKAARAVDVKRFGSHAALVLAGGNHTAWHADSSSFVRLTTKVLGPRVKRAFDRFPAVDDKKWRKTPLRLSVVGGLVAFDARARQRDPKPTKARGKARLELDVADGEYVVETIPSVKHDGVTLSLIRLYRSGTTPPALRAAPKAAAPAANSRPSVTAEVRKAASKLAWVGSAEGTAVIAVPTEHASAWRWAGHEEIDSKGVADVVTVGAGQALVLGDPESTAIHPLADGSALIIRRCAGKPADALAAALSVADATWKRTKKRFDAGSGKLVLLASGEEGAERSKSVSVRAGVHHVDEIASFDAAVGKSKVMLQLVRLRPTN